jgi:hypothetical protein
MVTLFGTPAAGVSAPGSGAGWDGSVSNFALNYPWLAPIQEVPADGGYKAPGDTVAVPAGHATALPFSGVDRDNGLPAPLTTSALTVALLFEGPDGQTWWAKRLN